MRARRPGRRHPASPPRRAVTRPYHHLPRGFRNPPGSPRESAGLEEYARFFWRRAREAARPVAVPEGHALAPAEVARGLAAAGASDSLTWLGHAAFLLRVNGATLLTDPYLTDWAGPVAGLGPRRFVPPALTPDRLPPLDAVLLSHNHYDHLDVATLSALPRKERTVAVVPLGLGRLPRSLGFAHVREVDWEESVRVAGVTVTALPAVHFSSRTPFDRNRTLWAGYAVAGPASRLYFAGDTAHGPVFADVGARHGPFDHALVPVGAYEPRSIMAAVHTSPEEAVRLGADLRARTLVAMHWGTVVLTDEPPFEPRERFLAAGRAAGYADERLWALAVGETRLLTPA